MYNERYRYFFKLFLATVLLASVPEIVSAQYNSIDSATTSGAKPSPHPKPTPKPKPTPTPLPKPDGESDWTGATSTAWNTGSNWTPFGGTPGGAPPVAGDVAWFKVVAGVSPSLATPVSIAGLYFSSTGSSGYSIVETATGAFTLTGSATDVSGAEISNATAVAIGANNTSGTNSIAVPITLAPSLGTTSTIFQAGGGTLNISGAISDGGGGIGISKTGGGTLTLSGASTYTGATTVNDGTLGLDNNNTTTARLAGTSNITVNSGGTLLLAQSGGTPSNDRINDGATMTLNGGTFNTGGLSEHGASNNAAGIGALTLQSSSIIDMGSGASIIAFADSHLASWSGTLSIYNWTGTPVTGSGTDQLYFGTDATGLTTTQVGEITFYSDSGTTSLGGATILADGEVVVAPEPSTWLAATLALGAFGYTLRKRSVRIRR